MTNYLSPNGTPIIGVLETVPAIAAISGISSDGATVEYSGGSDVIWDEQKPQSGTHGGFIFIDEDGEEWCFDQLTKENEE